MNAALLVLPALLCLAAEKPASKDDVKKELARLQGTWVMTALEVNGEAVPEKKLAGTTLTIKGDVYATKVKDTTHEVTIEVDPAQSPKAIDMLFPDGPEVPKRSKGIYDLDGDTLRICRHQTPGEDRPREFVTASGRNIFIVTWRRKK